MEFLTHTVVIGLVATLIMDAWSVLRRPLLGWSVADYRLIGRWMSYLPRGTFHHAAIGKAAPIGHEVLTGWVTHYATGLVYAAALLMLVGPGWARTPTVLPALTFGVVTVLVPYLVVQPAMGLGIAASRAPNARLVRVQNFVTHAVFGAGLYVGGLVAGELP